MTKLTVAERGYLDGRTTLRRFVSTVPMPGIIQATALLNQSTFIYPITQFTVDNTSADWSAVEANQTAIISRQANGVDPVWIGRTRKTPGATTLYVNRTSESDVGLIPASYTNTRFLDNMYVTVLRRFDIFSLFPYINYPGTGAINEDYDATYATSNSFNQYPGPVLRITINGLSGHWNGFADAGQSYATLVLVAYEDLWVTSSSITGRQWTLPASWTVVGGSLTSATVTARAPINGAEPYDIKYVATENHSSTSLARRLVWVYDTTGANAPFDIKVSQIGSDSRDRIGRRMTFNLVDTSLANIADGSMLVYWETPVWYDTSGVAHDIPSATRSFTGWVLAQTEVSDFGISDAAIEVVGPMGLLRRAEGQYFGLADTPASYQEIVSALAYVDFILWWLARRRAANLTELFDYNRAGISNLSGRRAQWRINPGNLAGQLRQVAAQFRLNFGCDSTGAVWVRKHPSTWGTGFRNSSLVWRSYFTGATAKNVTVRRSLQGSLGLMHGQGFSSDGVTDTELRAVMPGPEGGQGGGETTVSDLIVENQGDMNVLLAMLFAMDNNPLASVGTKFLRNLDIFEPATLDVYSLALAGRRRPDGSIWPGVAYAESHLTADMDDATTTLSSFSTSLQVWQILRVDDEYLLITADLGAGDYTVTRGFLDSTPAGHVTNTLIYRTLAMIPNRVSKAHGAGVADLDVDFEGETAGFAAATVAVPPPKKDLYANYKPPALPAPNPDYGNEDGSVPKTLFVLHGNGRFFRGGWNGSRFRWTDISPTATQRTAVAATMASNNYATKFVADPYRLNRVIALAPTGFLICDDVTADTPTWRAVTGFLPSGVTRLTYLNPSYCLGDLQASPNRAGFFVWTYIPSAGTGVGVQRTLDDFVTFSNGDITTTEFGGLKNAGLAISANTGAIWVNGVQKLYKSTDLAASFAEDTYPYSVPPDIGRSGPVNAPFSLPGGAPNTGDENLLTIFHRFNDGTQYAGWGDGASEYVQISPGDQLRASNGWESFTLDGNYINLVFAGGDVRSSDDGFATHSVSHAAVGYSGVNHCGLHGWPGNHNYLLIAGHNILAYSLDQGTTWNDLLDDLQSDIPSITTAELMDAQGYLGDRFPTGGVH